MVSCHLDLMVFTVTAERSEIEVLFSLDSITETSAWSHKVRKSQILTAGMTGTNDRKQYHTVWATFFFFSSARVCYNTGQAYEQKTFPTDLLKGINQISNQKHLVWYICKI